jgi:hypothetical protein
MITALVQFKLPPSVTREKAKEMFQSSAPKYEGLAGLHRKYYLFDPATGAAGGCYLWESRAAAEAVYTPAWRRVICERYGAEPVITYFETPVIVDNTHGSRQAAE